MLVGVWIGLKKLTALSLSQSQSGCGALCSQRVIQHGDPHWDCLKVSGASDSGSRATIGDTGEGELRDSSSSLGTGVMCRVGG